MITSQDKYDLGVQVAKCRTEGRSSDESTTKAEQELRGQVDALGGWDADAQLGFDDTLREHVQTRTGEPVEQGPADDPEAA